MEWLTRNLGTTALQIGPLGLGTAPLGNLYSVVSDLDAQRTLVAAQAQGVRWFDVAPLYGCGLAEVRLGQFLHRSKSDSSIVSTKVGRLLEPDKSAKAHAHFVSPLPFRPVFDYSRAGIERSHAESLTRLGVERIQLLLLHDVDRITHPTRHRRLLKQILDEALPTLHRLKAEKCVDAIGLGINQWDVGYEILVSSQIDCVLLAGRYTLLDSTAFTSGFLDACARRNVSVLAGGIFNSGFLAGGSHYDYRQTTNALMQRRDEIAKICQRCGVPLPAAALQFSAAHPAVASVVVGARSASEVDDIVGWTRAPIPADLWEELRLADLIPSDVPTPSYKRNNL